MEMVVLVDGMGNPIGTHPKRTVHHERTPRHLAFSCHLVDERGRLLITRRSLTKSTWPGVWTNAFCGHPEPGERMEDAVSRRARFELGVDVDIVECALPDFGYEARDASGTVENEHCPVFVARAVGEISPNPAEVAETAWTTATGLDNAVRSAPWAFSPWLVEHLDGVAPALGRAARSAGARGRESTSDLIEQRLAEIVARARRDADRFAPQYRMLWEAAGDLARGGKRIRSRLVIDAHRALGAPLSRDIVDAACAMELLHAALTIHDDVIDGDLMRRGRENVTGRFEREARERGASRRDARAWGEASALLAGDLLLTEAHSLLALLDLPQAARSAVLGSFRDAVFESAAGEHADVWLSMRLEPSDADDVLSMIEQKTAAYSFRAPLVVAAALAGAPREAVDALDAIGRRMGLVYQLRDDVLGTFGDERATGKSVMSDLREGKETMLVAHARAHPDWAAVDGLFGRDELSREAGDRVREIVERTGARTFVERMIDDTRNELAGLIDRAPVPAALADLLREAADACANRTS